MSLFVFILNHFQKRSSAFIRPIHWSNVSLKTTRFLSWSNHCWPLHFLLWDASLYSGSHWAAFPILIYLSQVRRHPSGVLPIYHFVLSTLNNLLSLGNSITSSLLTSSVRETANLFQCRMFPWWVFLPCATHLLTFKITTVSDCIEFDASTSEFHCTLNGIIKCFVCVWSLLCKFRRTAQEQIGHTSEN